MLILQSKLPTSRLAEISKLASVQREEENLPRHLAEY